MNQVIIKASELNSKLLQAIDGRQTFRVVDIIDYSQTINNLEKAIESKGLRCRVYTSKRSAALSTALIPTGLTQLVALGTAIGIGAHNLYTYSPDFEIVKYVSGDMIDVICKVEKNGTEQNVLDAGLSLLERFKVKQIDIEQSVDISKLYFRLKKYKNMEEAFVGFFAVAMAIAAIDDDISDEEMSAISEFSQSMTNYSVSAATMDEIHKMHVNPPSLEEALQLAASKKCKKDDISDIIRLVIHADGIVDASEKQIYDEWLKYDYPIA